jgi:hypothetical protein
METQGSSIDAAQHSLLLHLRLCHDELGVKYQAAAVCITDETALGKLRNAARRREAGRSIGVGGSAWAQANVRRFWPISWAAVQL